jgi:hypothetical protein
MSCKDCVNWEASSKETVLAYCDVQGENMALDDFCMSYLWRDDRSPLKYIGSKKTI